MPDKRQIVNSIAAMAKRLRRAPSREEFYARTGISAYFVLRYFRTWTEAVRAAGVHPYMLNARAQNRALLEDWGRVARKNRGMMARHIYLKEGNYSPGTLAKRFGGWTGVPEAFQAFAKGKKEWADVSAMLPDETAGRSGARARLEIAKEREESMRAASAGTTQQAWHAELSDRPVYGNPLEFRGVWHEPTNEQGVVLLFGMLAKELGYAVESVQTGFPDCEAKRQIGAERWQRVRIEFEFESRKFREHGHPMSGCDLIVCWRHNWPECPRHIEVLELCRVVHSLAVAKK